MVRWIVGLVLIGLLVGCGQSEQVDAQPSQGATSTINSAASVPMAARTLEQHIPTARAIYDDLLTATAAAHPAPTFLTVREAFNHAALRERSRRWAADAMLVDAQIGYLNEPIDLSEFAANDGTSRNWTVTFASPAQSSLHVFRVLDGHMVNDYVDEKAYRDLFVGIIPRDIPLEKAQIIDSDQARIVFLQRFGDSWEKVSQYQIFRLSSLPSKDNSSATDGYWLIQDTFDNRSLIDGQTGQTLYTSFDEEVAAIVVQTNTAGPTAAPLIVQPTLMIPIEAELQEAFFRQSKGIKHIEGTFRFAGLYATDGNDYWNYTENGWVSVFPVDRQSLLRTGVPAELINE